MTNLTPDELGALADLERDELSAWAGAATKRIVADEPWHAPECRDPECFGDCHTARRSCGACGGWHAPGENCDLDDIWRTAGAGEGWAIFECFGSDYGDWQIQRDDEDPRWDDDDEVWAWLYFRCIHGDPVAARALAWVCNANPYEHALLKRFLVGPRDVPIGPELFAHIRDRRDG